MVTHRDARMGVRASTPALPAVTIPSLITTIPPAACPGIPAATSSTLCMMSVARPSGVSEANSSRLTARACSSKRYKRRSKSRAQRIQQRTTTRSKTSLPCCRRVLSLISDTGRLILSELSTNTASGTAIFCNVCNKTVGLVRKATMSANASKRQPSHSERDPRRGLAV